MKRTVLLFEDPYRMGVRREELECPGPGRLLVRTLATGISSGTELLLYRGQMPTGLSLDATIPSLQGSVGYPAAYGYAAVGEVAEAGPGVARGWIGRRVFSFQPHASAFTASESELIPLPPDLDVLDGVMLPDLETAVNLVQDATPRFRERVLVVGQGVIGLLCTALLARFPLESLSTLERIAPRRQRGIELGADASFDPDGADTPARMRELLSAKEGTGLADCSLEVSGNPQGLQWAIDWTGFGGRIVAGSWYGAKKARIDLGTAFHRGRQEIVSSQVSTIAPGLSARWDKSRRMEAVLRELERIRPSRLVSHEFPLEQGSEAFRLLDSEPERVLKVVFRCG
jgi:2-desacetyl-2-hydroxyethyl bacteriochlorophyllide A dehydrogenase